MSALKLPTIEHHAVKALVPWGDNPRLHDGEQMRLLQKSMERYGLAALPVIQKGTRRILAGHGRVEALMNLGEGSTVIPCITLDVDLEGATAYTVADNRLAERSKWNRCQLREIVAELDNGAFEVEDLGFTEDEINRLFGPLIDVPDDGEGDGAEGAEQPPLVLELWIYSDRVEVLDESRRPDLMTELIRNAISTLLFPPQEISNVETPQAKG